MAEVRSKQEMYRLLEEGAFGNTICMYTDLEEWAYFADSMPTWGIRTFTPGGPCRLNCPEAEVAEVFACFESNGHKAQISAMISNVGQVLWLGDVWDSPTGIQLTGIELPPKVHNWRELMRTPQRWTGLQAKMTLRKYLNPNSLGDLYEVFENYPGHVVELSAMDRNFGIIPRRNAIVWEVRSY